MTNFTKEWICSSLKITVDHFDDHAIKVPQASLVVPASAHFVRSWPTLASQLGITLQGQHVTSAERDQIASSLLNDPLGVYLLYSPVTTAGLLWDTDHIPAIVLAKQVRGSFDVRRSS